MNYNRIFAPILIGITLLMAVILTRPLYGAYLDKDVVLTRLTAEKEYKEKTLSALATMEKSLSQGATGSTDLIKKIKKISKKWDTSDIMSTVMLNKFTLTNQFNRANISIGSITVDPGSKLPNGLSLGTVSCSVSATTLQDMIDYISYLTQDSDYVFTIDEISLPIDTQEVDASNAGLTLSLSLGVYYYK